MSKDAARRCTVAGFEQVTTPMMLSRTHQGRENSGNHYSMGWPVRHRERPYKLLSSSSSLLLFLCLQRKSKATTATPPCVSQSWSQGFFWRAMVNWALQVVAG